MKARILASELPPPGENYDILLPIDFDLATRLTSGDEIIMPKGFNERGLVFVIWQKIYNLDADTITLYCIPAPA